MYFTINDVLPLIVFLLSSCVSLDQPLSVYRQVDIEGPEGEIPFLLQRIALVQPMEGEDMVINQSLDLTTIHDSLEKEQ